MFRNHFKPHRLVFLDFRQRGWAHFFFLQLQRCLHALQLPIDVPILWNKRFSATAARFNACSRTLALSVALLTRGERLRDSIFHEMTHAAVSLINGLDTRRSHNAAFREW